MKTISPELKAHQAGTVTTLCYMWKATRQNGSNFTYTNLDRDVVYLGHTYLASSGFTASNITTSDLLNVDNLEINSMIRSDNITESDIAAALWDYCKFDIFRVNYTDLSMGPEDMRSGTIGEISTGRINVVLELRGVTQNYQQSIGQPINAACPHDFCDVRTPSVPRCHLSPVTFTFTGTVDSISNRSIFADSGQAKADGYFTGGLLTWTSGLNNTYQKEVKGYTLHDFELVEAMPNMITIGDTYSCIKGCDKTKGAGGCNAPGVANIVNFGGFDLPGQDRLLSAT